MPIFQNIPKTNAPFKVTAESSNPYELALQNFILIARIIFLVCLFFLDISTTNAQVNGSQLRTTSNGDPSSGLLPLPQKMELTEKKFPITKNWKIVTDPALAKEQPTISLQEGLKEAGLTLSIATQNAYGSSPAIRLVVEKGSVSIEASVDTNRTAIERQAYRLSLKSGHVTITANASQGLYYGVQTFCSYTGLMRSFRKVKLRIGLMWKSG